MSLRLRSYEAADLEALHALDVLCFDPPFRFSLRTMRRFAEAKNARVLIAEEMCSLAGFVIVHLEAAQRQRTAYVVTLDVAPDHRRRGIASRLMFEAERIAAAEGCSAMLLHVFTGNPAAVRFYDRLGYAKLHRVPGFYGEDRDAWCCRKLLDPRPAPI